MKYVIARQFSFTNHKFDIISDAKTVSTVKARESKRFKGQFNLKLSNLINKYLGDSFCLVEPDENQSRRYLIYSIDERTGEKTLFGTLFYQFCQQNNYLYEITIKRKLYRVRSADLKDRRLAIIDIVQPIDPSKTDPWTRFHCSQTLFQVTDSFCKSNEKYHVNIHPNEWSLGYLAITILLHLHECQRNSNAK